MSEEFVMPFGKYRGSTLEEIHVEDPSYLHWAYETVDNEEVRNAILEFCG